MNIKYELFKRKWFVVTPLVHLVCIKLRKFWFGVYLALSGFFKLYLLLSNPQILFPQASFFQDKMSDKSLPLKAVLQTVSNDFSKKTQTGMSFHYFKFNAHKIKS